MSVGEYPPAESSETRIRLGSNQSSLRSTIQFPSVNMPSQVRTSVMSYRLPPARSKFVTAFPPG